MKQKFPVLILFSSIIVLPTVLPSCRAIENLAIDLLTEDYKPEGQVDSGLTPQYLDADAQRERIPVALSRITTVFQPTDIQFPPGGQPVMLITEKSGKLNWFDLRKQSGGVLAQLEVPTRSEQGLLGLAFHPDFAENGKIYLNYSVARDGGDISRVSEWRISDPDDIGDSKLTDERVVLEVEQPYNNHNAGQLAFGPDGMLYVGWGDGGLRADPLKAGQDASQWLGSMLRIDVRPDARTGKAYTVPADNPFLGRQDAAPETFAIGLRNPWRYSFDPAGRLIVADVGQDKWEEISIVEAGKNYGWNVREASHCFEPETGCRTKGLVDPIYEYPRDEGKSITGGYVYTGARIPALKGLYVFGDFVSGRLWALPLPERADAKAGPAKSLGKWSLLPSTFGRDAGGEIYLGDFASGSIYRLEPGA